MNINKAVEWIVETDRRLITLRAFKELGLTSVSKIALKTGRTTQNISNAVEELEEEKIVECVGEHKHSWRKYKLTERGFKIFDIIEREYPSNKSKAIATDLEMKLVKDAYRLIITTPIKVHPKATIGDVIAQLLKEPRTRTAYLVDANNKLEGTITLQQLLKSILKYVDSNESEEFRVPNGPHTTLNVAVRPIVNKPITVRPDDKLSNALRKMSEHQLEDIAVVDANERLLGELNGIEILTVLMDLHHFKKMNYGVNYDNERPDMWRK